MFYLLAGRPPFDADDLADLLDRIASEPLDLTGVSTLPAGLSTVLSRCLASDRHQRYQSYAELREALVPCATPDARPESMAHRVAAAALDLIVMLPLVGVPSTRSGSPEQESRTRGHHERARRKRSLDSGRVKSKPHSGHHSTRSLRSRVEWWRRRESNLKDACF